MRTCSFAMLLTLCVSSLGAAPPKAVEQYWTDVLDANLMSRAVLEREAYAWPATHSASFPFKDQAAAEQNARHLEMATTMLEELRALRTRVNSVDKSLSKTEFAALVVLKRRFSTENAYINILLTDCVERILVADLLEILASSQTLPPTVTERTERLRQGTLDLHAYATMCASELGRPFAMFRDEPTYEEYGHKELVESLDIFWRQLTKQPLESILIPVGTADSAITGQHLGQLFRFRIHTEHVRCSVLPLILEYRRWAGEVEPVLNHEYGKIRDVCERREFPDRCISLLNTAFQWSKRPEFEVDSVVRAVRQDASILGF